VVTGIVTALLAVLVFVVTQSFLKIILEPIQDQRKLIGEIAHALLFYANVYHLHIQRPDEEQKQEIDNAKKAFRELAGRLRASLWTIPLYDALALLGRVPKQQDVLAASDALVGWSNSLYGREEATHRREYQKVIADRLGISKRIILT
jgi:hypothetical protein